MASKSGLRRAISPRWRRRRGRRLDRRSEPAGLFHAGLLGFDQCAGVIIPRQWILPLEDIEAAGGALIEAQKTGMEETGRLAAPGEAEPPSPSPSRGEIARRSPDFEPMDDGGFEGPPHPSGTAGEDAGSSQEASQRLLRRTPLPASTRTPIPVAPAVIPLVHAPDDPGPEPQAQNGTGPQSSDEPAADNWTRIRHLFRS